MRAIALVFAVLLYVVVYAENEPKEKDIDLFGSSDTIQTIDDYPVEVRIDRDKYVVSGVPEQVTVQIEGSNSEVTRAMKLRNFTVYADLDGLGEGEHTVELKYENVSEGLSVYIEPKIIDVVIEERSTKEFDVHVDFINTNQLPEGFELGDYEVNPQKVRITSSKSVIDKISIVKVFVNVSGLTNSINNREVPVKVYDSQGNELRVRIEPENVVVSADIRNPSKKVPLSISTTGKLPEGYKLESIQADVEEVEVFATTDILKGIDQLTTEDIDLSKVKKSGTLETKLKLPKGVVAPDVDSIHVTVEVEQTRTIQTIPLEVENLSDGQAITFKDPANESISITVVGNEKDVSALKAEDFRAFIDVRGLDEGEHQVPITIDGPDGITVEGNPKQATIEISNKLG